MPGRLSERDQFRQAVDHLMASEKAVTGRPKWERGSNPPDQECYWTIAVHGQATAHRLQIEARMETSFQRFCVLLRFAWGGGAGIVVTRVNHDPDEQAHVNTPPRPSNVPAAVHGSRMFLWPLNRNSSRPGMRGLPFALPLERKHQDLHNAIRFVAGECRISLADASLPDYPLREGLF